MRNASGAASANGTSPFASTARPIITAAAGSNRSSRLWIHGSASSIAAEKVAVSGRSGTPVWLKPSHATELPRISVANHAARQPNSRRRIHQ